MIEKVETRSPKGEETRRRILEAARRVLAEEGLERFTTRRVARAADVSHGMCHYYFVDKNELVRAPIEQARIDWVDPLQKLVSANGSAEMNSNLHSYKVLSAEEEEAWNDLFSEVVQG
jgi:AcrR family transcriptional regulator